MVRERNLHAGENLEIATDAGLRVCHVNGVRAGSEFTVDVSTGMGIPSFKSRSVKLASGAIIQGIEVSTGNPHFVIVVDNVVFVMQDKSWQEAGAEICVHPDFPTRPMSNSCASSMNAR